MDTSIPDYLNINFAVNKKEAEKMIDWGVQLHTDRSEIQRRNRKMYNSYNGIIDKSKLNSITKKTGSTSATPYISYRIGRNKVKQLIGEFLQIGLSATVFTINPEARKAKYDKYMKLISLAMMKPQIEKMRQMGAEVYPGIKIPNGKEISISNETFKSTNEIIMQILADHKIQQEKMLVEFLESWRQLILTSEISGKVDKNIYNSDYFRPIDVNDAVFLESPNEIIVKRSPIMGEARLMYLHEIISELKPTKDEIEKIKLNPTTDTDGIQQRKAGQQLYRVYSFQWLGKKIIRRKSTTNSKGINYTKFIDEETYEKDKDKIERDIQKRKYSIIDETEQLTIYEGSRVIEDVYLNIKEKEGNIVQKDETGIERIEFDYVFGLFNTVGGIRVPLQAIIHEMELVYNAIRRQLNIEIGKLKGSHVIFDEAFTGKTLTQMYSELSEHGMTTVNSAEKGTVGDDREGVIERVMKDFNLGDSQTISTLMALALDIEQTLDRQIGMNQDRQGLGSASSTATTNQNNVNASQSMTYDMFYFIQLYMNEVVTKLLEKVKINWDWLENEEQALILSDEQYGYLKATKDLSLDSYGAFVSDGKLERDITRKLEQYFLQDINAGKLRTVDVAEFYTSKSFAQGIKTLKDAHKELTAIQQKQEQAKGQQSGQQNQQKIQAEHQFREDGQQHDKDSIVLKSKMKENEIITKGNIDKGINSQNKIRDHAKAVDIEKTKTELAREEENISK